ncbi:TIGR01777 family oxidoreductase [Neptunomonas sp. XY-337]|uniref:TIGR01777 family oxidoreductase n=1 Tax=Neptunomonas sp. XY-337 TaxID=2561897 RepID=UPI0010AA8B25|nr:TIGR01777 family oxidoreductase [Neptunomonas sp. XY-337]
MNYLVTGGTGFIGQQLVKELIKSGNTVTVVSRQPHKVAKLLGQQVHAVSPDDIKELDANIDVVVNLAGAPIVDKRWSEHRKALLRDSRIAFTEQLINDLETIGAQPSCFISGSAIGFYGSHSGGSPLDEQGSVAPGFTHDLCRDWENAAQSAQTKLGSRVCTLRTGVVVGPNGGALKKMITPFKLGLGGPIGHGLQWMSWVHLDDEVAAIQFLVAHDTLQGPFNLTAPGAVTNETFSHALGRAVNRPAKLRMPAVVMELMLGEASELLTQGQRVFPGRLLEAGFTFKYPELKEALAASV